MKGPSQEYAGGGHIIVLTDGEENVDPRVEQVYGDVIASVSFELCGTNFPLRERYVNTVVPM